MVSEKSETAFSASEPPSYANAYANQSKRYRGFRNGLPMDNAPPWTSDSMASAVSPSSVRAYLYVKRLRMYSRVRSSRDRRSSPTAFKSASDRSGRMNRIAYVHAELVTTSLAAPV